jgi:hypothetical protein
MLKKLTIRMKDQTFNSLGECVPGFAPTRAAGVIVDVATKWIAGGLESAFGKLHRLEERTIILIAAKGIDFDYPESITPVGLSKLIRSQTKTLLGAARIVEDVAKKILWMSEPEVFALAMWGGGTGRGPNRSRRNSISMRHRRRWRNKKGRGYPPPSSFSSHASTPLPSPSHALPT